MKENTAKVTVNQNNVSLCGVLAENFTLSHESHNEKFYCAKIAIKRLSETEDILPITVSERLVAVNDAWKGQYVRISGSFRSYNKHEEGRTRLILSVFVDDIEPLGFENIETLGDNVIEFDGYITKPPTYRETPLKRQIADVLLAVNRNFGMTDYLPCVFWGRNAKFTSTLSVGTHLKLVGRIQSRQYFKKFNETDGEWRTAYEVSIKDMEVMEDEQKTG